MIKYNCAFLVINKIIIILIVKNLRLFEKMIAFFRLLIEKKYKGKKSGFIHIPFLPEQVVDKRNTPSMELSTIVKGLTAAIEAIVKNDEDIKEVGGTVC